MFGRVKFLYKQGDRVRVLYLGDMLIKEQYKKDGNPYYWITDGKTIGLISERFILHKYI